MRSTSRVLLRIMSARPRGLFDNLHGIFGTFDNDPGMRSAELVLSQRDTCFWCLARIREQMTPIGQDPVLWGHELLEWDILRIINRFHMHCGMASREIIHGWHSRFNLLAQLPLEHLVLDMRETYSLDQHCLGVNTAKGFKDFTHGVPKVSRVLAPSTELADGGIPDFHNLACPMFLQSDGGVIFGPALCCD